MAEIDLDEQYERDAEWAEYCQNERYKRIAEALEGVEELEQEHEMTEPSHDRDAWELIAALRNVLELLEKRYGA